MEKKRLLIIGCGDVALRAVRLLRGRYRLYGLVRESEKAQALRALGITPLVGDLDKPESLGRLAGIAELVLHTAPPPAEDVQDSRTANLLRMLTRGLLKNRRRMLPQRVAYISTSGVYGNCAGELVPETRPVNPGSQRARLRVDAERRLRHWGKANRVSVALLRAPGIYAADRLPLQRIKTSLPVVQAEEDGYTNHIHADDLARVALVALSHRGGWGRSYNVSDDSKLKMGDYFDLVADHFLLPRPPRISRARAEQEIPASRLSFLAESRRLSNTRLRKELGIKLRYPTVADFLNSAAAASLGEQAR